MAGQYIEIQHGTNLGDNLSSGGTGPESSASDQPADWKPVAEIPRSGGWQRIAAKMGYHYTDPYLMQRVDTRERQRRTDGLVRQARLDAPAEPTSKDVTDLINKMDDVMEILESRTSQRRQVSAPPRPSAPRPPNPSSGGRPGRGGVQLP